MALFIVLLDALPVAQIPLHAPWNQHGSSSAGDASSPGVKQYVNPHQWCTTLMSTSTHGTGASLTSSPMKASAAASGDAEKWRGTEIDGLPVRLSSESELSVLDNTPGVSLAASVDPDGNRQLFDLSSNGTVRLVRVFSSPLSASAVFLALQYAWSFLHLRSIHHGSTLISQRKC